MFADLRIFTYRLYDPLNIFTSFTTHSRYYLRFAIYLPYRQCQGLEYVNAHISLAWYLGIKMPALHIITNLVCITKMLKQPKLFHSVWPKFLLGLDVVSVHTV
jgi:hypothetical protein